MTFKMHYTVGAVEDCLIIDGDTLDVVIASMKQEMQRRGLDREENHMWSEQVGV